MIPSMVYKIANNLSGNINTSDSAVTVTDNPATAGAIPSANKRNISDTSFNNFDNSLERNTKQGKIVSSSPSRHVSDDKDFMEYLESKFSCLNDNMESNSAELNSRIDNMNDTLTSRIDDLCVKFSAVESRLAEQDANIVSLQQRFLDLEHKNADLSTRITQLESRGLNAEPDSWQPTGSADIKIALIGDSNSAGKLKFGGGKGTLGAALPGCHAFAPKVENLPPPDAEIYRGATDIIIAVGTNNLRDSRCVPEDLVLDTFNRVKSLSKSHPAAHVFLPGVLPMCTNEPGVNDKIRKYNYFLNDMCKSLSRVSYLDMRSFASNTGSLQAKFSLGPEDPLHLNNAGLRFYFSRFKYALRSRHNLPIPKRASTVRNPPSTNIAQSENPTGTGNSRGTSVNRGSRGGR